MSTGLNKRCHHTRIMPLLCQHYKDTTYLTDDVPAAVVAAAAAAAAGEGGVGCCGGGFGSCR